MHKISRIEPSSARTHMDAIMPIKPLESLIALAITSQALETTRISLRSLLRVNPIAQPVNTLVVKNGAILVTIHTVVQQTKLIDAIS